jgi:hypothetical protein
MYYLRTDSTDNPDKRIVGRRTCDVKLQLLRTLVNHLNVKHVLNHMTLISMKIID